MNILVAVDGSRTCRNAVTYLTTHFSMLGTDSEGDLITVHAPIPPHAAHTLGRTTMTQSYYDDEAEKAFEAGAHRSARPASPPGGRHRGRPGRRDFHARHQGQVRPRC